MKYKQTHDHLGNPVRPPWRIADLVVCAFLIGVITALVGGVFA